MCTTDIDMNTMDPLEQINEHTIEKYKTAGVIAKKCVDVIIKAIKKDVTLDKLVVIGDQYVEQALKNVFKDIEYKGLSFPICLSKNNIAGHYRPYPDSKIDESLNHGDLLKIELSVHIDGYSSNIVYTTIIKLDDTPLPEKPLNALKAAVIASKDVVSLMKPGKTSKDVVKTLEKYAKKYGCNMAISSAPGVVPGVFSHQVSRNILNGYDDDDDNPHRFIMPRDNPQYDFVAIDNEFEEDEVYAIDILMSTGSGKLVQIDEPRVFSRDYEKKVPLKLNSSKQALGIFKGKYFAQVYDHKDAKLRLGLKDCLKKGLFKPYQVVAEHGSEYVVRIKFTVIVKDNPILVCGKVADAEIDKYKKKDLK